MDDPEAPDKELQKSNFLWWYMDCVLKYVLNIFNTCDGNVKIKKNQIWCQNEIKTINLTKIWSNNNCLKKRFGETVK